MAKANDGIMTAGALHVELEIPIEAPRARVWKAFVAETGEWWRKDFLVTREPKAFVFEARLGGRVFEDQGDGNGFVWYTVMGITPPESVYLIGHIAPPYGGPATSLLQFTFEAPSATRTLLKVSDSLLGHVDGKFKSSMEEGWNLLLEQSLKTYVEQRK